MLKAYPRTEWMKDYPIMNPHLIAKFYKMFQGLSKGSIMSEGRPHVPYVFSALNNYVHSAVVFDSSLDTDKLITEFCQLAAPEAAAELEAFYNSMEKLLDGAYFTAEPLRNYYLSFRLKNPSAHLSSAAQKAPGNKFVQQLAKDFAAFEKNSIAESPGIGSEAELQAIYKSFDRKKAPLKLSSTPDESELLPFSIYYDFQKSSAQISRQGDHIAVTVTCQENNMDKLKAACKKNHNGPVWNDDSVEVFICRPEDSKSYIQLIINSLGVYRVMFCDESGVVTDKPAFNFTARGIKSGDSWQVQMLIPIGDIADMIKNNAVNMGIYRNRPAKNRTEVQQSGIQKPHNNSFKNPSGHFRVEL